MEDVQKGDSDSLKRRHFAKLHEKILNKFNDMQKKLDKSKSVDSLRDLSEEYVYKEERHSSQCDVREADEVFSDTITDCDRTSVTYSILEEDVHKREATLQELNREESVYESDFVYVTPIEDSDKQFFGDDFKISQESLNEVSKESDEYLTHPTPSPKISIRDKIGSRISAAKEKRREGKEKNANKDKDKKKESREKVEKTDDILCDGTEPSSVRESDSHLAGFFQFVLSNTTKQDVLKKKYKVATVTIALVEGTVSETEMSSEEKTRFFYCRLRLGAEKRKSKSIRSNGSLLNWQELFNLNMHEDHIVEISMWDKDISLGRVTVDLSEVEKEKTHKMRLNLEDGVAKAQIFILLTISGTTLVNTFIDLDDYQESQDKLDSKKIAWYHLKDDSTDVGWLSIIVFGAKGLSANECYCVIELTNERLQTHTEYKTHDPNWMKMFTFAITDVTSILEFTVYDEKKSDEVGKISIPLLKIENGRKKWYALKDNTQRDKAKGNNPRILLEMNFTWNLVKASIRAINPKEVKYLEAETKFDRHVFGRNIIRAKAVITWTLDAFKVIKTCFEWESRKWNTIALTIWLLFCWFFKVWMLPLLLLVPFAWYRPEKYFIFDWKKYVKPDEMTEDIDDKDDKNKTLRQKINSLQEMVLTVQNGIGKFSCLGESIKNLFNFTVPFISCLAIFFVVMIAFFMYIIPVRYIFMGWGLHKFTRKILRPNRIPNSEILDLLSRVPDDETLLNCEELPLQDLSNEDEI